MTTKQGRSDLTRVLCAAAWAALIVTTNVSRGQEMKNVLTDIPYTEGQMGKRQPWALKVGGSNPPAPTIPRRASPARLVMVNHPRLKPGEE